MKKNNILKTKDGVFRVLKIDGDRVLAIDCEKKTMPKFYPNRFFDTSEVIDFGIVTNLVDYDSLSQNDRCIAQQRFSMIASVIAVIDDEKKRTDMISHSAELFDVSKATIRNYLCTYLASQNILGHFANGGTLININILDKKTLLEAHENPESHPDLVVRVTGFTAYFATQLVVDRSWKVCREHALKASLL